VNTLKTGKSMRKKILLADDTITVRTLEKALLGNEFDYVEAENGRIAFTTAVAEKPDLILLDINMPIESGISALAKLKADTTTARIPVIMVSTRGEDSTVAECNALGCADYVIKPVRGETLRAVVKRHLK
jgi:putative two-component system response regulator